MSSRAQKRANRANARKSTGPRTQTGRAAAAQNAVRHGLAGGFTVLAYEDQDQFEQLLASYTDDYAPADTAERFLVQQMAKAHWTLARAERIANCVFNHLSGIDQPASPDLDLAVGIVEKSDNPILTVERYRAAAERTYHRSKRELEQARLRRIRQARPEERPAPSRQVPYHQQVVDRNMPVRNEANRPAGMPSHQPANPQNGRADCKEDGQTLYPNAFRSLAQEALDRIRAQERKS